MAHKHSEQFGPDHMKHSTKDYKSHRALSYLYSFSLVPVFCSLIAKISSKNMGGENYWLNSNLPAVARPVRAFEIIKEKQLSTAK